MNEQQFTCQLMLWHSVSNTRKMPWKGEKDPYKIWLSEIILQQTRVEQGWEYYERFIQNYPTIKDLAAAEDNDVFKLWEGLGYYNRCKNLLFTARNITENYKGEFPNEYNDILSLKGIGTYTAAAITSFAFDLPYAVVDGNVLRVLSRVFGIDKAVDSTEGKKQIGELAQRLLDKDNPASYNQAIMDFGATVCLPSTPLCKNCPLREICFAFKNKKVHQLPVKEKMLLKKDRWFTYFIFDCNGKILVSKRIKKDIWQNLHEFYLVERSKKTNWNASSVIHFLSNELAIQNAEVNEITSSAKQELTHLKIHAQFVHVILNAVPSSLANFEWIEVYEMERLAFPKVISRYLHSKYFSPALL